MKVKVYGIIHCDTVKAARAWLAQQSVDSDFHDFKTAGMPAARLDAWLAAVGWDALLNRKGTTWRRLDLADRDRIVGSEAARQLMLDQPSIVRRPVVEWRAGDAGPLSISVGFDPKAWAVRLSRA